MSTRGREGYAMALEGIRFVLSASSADDPDRADLLELYRALALLAGRAVVVVAPEPQGAAR